MFKVYFQPDNISVLVEPYTTILQAASNAGIPLKSACGGTGTCGKCLVTVLEGKYDLKDDTLLRRTGRVPACQGFICSDMKVEIPNITRLSKHQVFIDKESVLREKTSNLTVGYELSPLVMRIYLILPRPTLNENSSDLSRLNVELKKHLVCKEIKISLPILQKLAHALRSGDWTVTVDVAKIEDCAEIIDILPGKTEATYYGLAVDIGTTTVVVSLVDLADGNVISTQGNYNKQAKFGDDVITRMIYADEELEGLGELQGAVLNTIIQLTEDIITTHPVIDKNNIKVVTCAGNTTMIQLLLALDPKYIRLEPYIPTAKHFPPVKLKDTGLPFYQEGWLMCLPAVASYVGGDVVAGALVTGIEQACELTLFIDIGTNGEMILGNKDWMITCACSAGPAFEGGGITFGMRAMQGAIERIEISTDFELSCQIIGNEKAIGICGSGLIDCLSALYGVGIIDRSGKMQTGHSSSRVRMGNDGPEFVLMYSDETGVGEDIVITESDIKNLLRAKAAIFAGIRSMTAMVGVEMSEIQKINIAGGFGNYLNIEDAIRIGFLPDIDKEKYQFVGNTSLKGALAVLLSSDAYIASLELCKKMTYLELSNGNLFMDEFVSATFIPHTDLSLFPSLYRC